MSSVIDVSVLSEKQRESLLRQMAANDFELFWNYCWPDEPIARHHLEWYDKIKIPETDTGLSGSDGSDRLLIGAPRGFGKSTYVIRQILFEIGRNPNMLITIVTADSGLGVDILREIASNIERNDRLKRVFPNLKPGEPWSKTQVTVKRDSMKKDASIRTAGLFSTGVGGRSDLMIFDDCTSHKTAVDQPKLREASIKIFYEVWMNFLRPNGRVIYVCTPWHILDLSMDIRNSGAFDEWWKPALNEEGESTWPEVWPTEMLIQKRAIDKRSFDHQYMLKPFSEAELVFNFDTIAMGAGDEREPKPEWEYYFGVDLAPSLNPNKGSYSALFVLGVDPQEERPVRHVIDIIRVRAKAPEFMDLVIDANNKYNPQCIMVENNGYQQAMIDFMESTGTNLPIEGYRTGVQRLDLQQGVPAIAPLFARELFRYPVSPSHLDERCDCNICQWIEELKMFPSGKSSDTVMAMWLAERAYSHSKDFIGRHEPISIYTDDDFTDDDIEYDEFDDIGEGSLVDWL